MKHHGDSFPLRFLRDQRGQTAVVLAVSVLVTATLGQWPRLKTHSIPTIQVDAPHW
jgi:hypothetical protein